MVNLLSTQNLTDTTYWVGASYGVATNPVVSVAAFPFSNGSPAYRLQMSCSGTTYGDGSTLTYTTNLFTGAVLTFRFRAKSNNGLPQTIMVSLCAGTLGNHYNSVITVGVTEAVYYAFCPIVAVNPVVVSFETVGTGPSYVANPTSPVIDLIVGEFQLEDKSSDTNQNPSTEFTTGKEYLATAVTSTKLSCWGDSLTWGVGCLVPWPMQMTLGHTWVSADNNGVPGDTSGSNSVNGGCLARMLADTSLASKHVVIWIGRNNAWQYDASFYADIAAMVSHVGHSNYLLCGLTAGDSYYASGYTDPYTEYSGRSVSFTGSISGTTLTVSTMGSGSNPIVIGMPVYTANQAGYPSVASGTTITSIISSAPVYTPYDVAAGGYSGHSLLVYDFLIPYNPITSMASMLFDPTGTKLYFLGTASGIIIEHFNLSTAWDITTATPSAIGALNVATQCPDPRGIAFNSGGTVLYVTDASNAIVYQYPLATAWEPHSASTGSSFFVGTQDWHPRGICFNPAGTIMYVATYSSDTIYQYTLSTAWNVTTASYAGKSIDTLTAGADTPCGLTFSSDGLHFVITGGWKHTDTVYEFVMSTAWDISTASYTGNSLVLTAQDTVLTGLAFIPSTGLTFYVCGQASAKCYQYTVGASSAGQYGVSISQTVPSQLMYGYGCMYQQRMAINATLASLYGARYVDLMAALLGAGNGSTQDNTDIANGLIPTSLRADRVHLNAAGYGVVANAVWAKGAATLGWGNGSYTTYAPSALPQSATNLIPTQNLTTTATWVSSFGGAAIAPVVTASGTTPNGNTSYRLQLGRTGLTSSDYSQVVYTPPTLGVPQPYPSVGNFGSTYGNQARAVLCFYAKSNTAYNQVVGISVSQYMIDTEITVTPAWQKFEVENSYFSLPVNVGFVTMGGTSGGGWLLEAQAVDILVGDIVLEDVTHNFNKNSYANARGFYTGTTSSTSTLTSIRATCYGDSLTYGYGHGPCQPWPKQMTLAHNWLSAENNGVSGESSTQISKRLLTDTTLADKFVILWAGTQ